MKIDLELRPQLKKSLYSLKIMPDQIAFTFTKNETVIYKLSSEVQKELLPLLDGENTIIEIYETLIQKGFNCSIEYIVEEIERLYNLYLLEFNVTYNNSRYSRQEIFWGIHSKNGYSFSEKIQEKIKNTSIVLLGIGGFGSHILYNISYIGFGKIKCIDYDKVHISNLNRQILYKEKDIGKLKTLAAMKNIREINSEINYEFENKKIESKNDIIECIKGFDIAILAADSPRDKIFSWMNEAAFETGVSTLFSLGFTSRYIRIGPLYIPNKTICFNCSMPDINFQFNDPIVEFINSRNLHGSIIPYISIAAGLLCLELVKHISKFEKCMLYNSRLNFDVINYTIEQEFFHSKDNCAFCKEIN